MLSPCWDVVGWYTCRSRTVAYGQWLASRPPPTPLASFDSRPYAIGAKPEFLRIMDRHCLLDSKKDNELCCFVEYLDLDKMTGKDYFSFLRMDTCSDSLGQATTLFPSTHSIGTGISKLKKRTNLRQRSSGVLEALDTPVCLLA